MNVSFVRVRGQRDRIYAQRSDGTEVSWVFPTYGDELPHDLVHLVVESAFGLRQGFWGRVDAGVDPARVNDQANRKGGADKYRAFGDDQREIMIGEGLAAARWQDATLTDEALGRAIVESCARFRAEPPCSVTPARVAEVRRTLLALRDAWQAIAEKGTLMVRFDPAVTDLSRLLVSP